MKFESKKKVLSVSLVLHLMAFLVIMYTLLYIFYASAHLIGGPEALCFQGVRAYVHTCMHAKSEASPEWLAVKF